jgi:hypothetical protein
MRKPSSHRARTRPRRRSSHPLVAEERARHAKIRGRTCEPDHLAVRHLRRPSLAVGHRAATLLHHESSGDTGSNDFARRPVPNRPFRRAPRPRYSSHEATPLGARLRPSNDRALRFDLRARLVGKPDRGQREKHQPSRWESPCTPRWKSTPPPTKRPASTARESKATSVSALTVETVDCVQLVVAALVEAVDDDAVLGDVTASPEIECQAYRSGARPCRSARRRCRPSSQ